MMTFLPQGQEKKIPKPNVRQDEIYSSVSIIANVKRSDKVILLDCKLFTTQFPAETWKERGSIALIIRTSLADTASFRVKFYSPTFWTDQFGNSRVLTALHLMRPIDTFEN